MSQRTKLAFALLIALILTVFFFLSIPKSDSKIPLCIIDDPRGKQTLDDLKSMGYREEVPNDLTRHDDVHQRNTDEITDNHVPCNADRKVLHFVMTKIEKTGSSTLFSMLARFIEGNKLNLLSQKNFHHISWGRAKGLDWDIGPAPVERADALINHAKYNKAVFDKYMVEDYKYIVPVREPVSWMKSAVKYYHRLKALIQSSTEKVIADNNLMFRRREKGGMKTTFHLTQLQWLGFDYGQRNNMTAIREHIASIVLKIDIPILTDQFDASLIILRKRFCWDYADIFYASYEVTHSQKESLSDKAIQRLLSKEVNLGEKLLYDAVNRTWWRQPETREGGFWEEVSYFSRLNQRVTSTYCKKVTKTKKPCIISSTQYHGNITVTVELCSFLGRSKCTMVQNTIRYAQGVNTKLGWTCGKT